MTTAPSQMRERSVRCPACGGASLYAATNPYRPFCSARCRGGDLGAWASEGYRVPAAPDPEADANRDDPAEP